MEGNSPPKKSSKKSQVNQEETKVVTSSKALMPTEIISEEPVEQEGKAKK